MKRAGQRRKRTRSKHWSPELKSLTKMRSIAIIGHGFVGKATEYLFERFYPETEIQIHDPDQGHEIEDWNGIQYAFICVPTNLKGNKLDTSIIDKVLKGLSERSCAGEIVPVIRSTIGPDQALEYAKNYGAIIMPEFLREKHWQQDVDNMNIPILIGCHHCNDFIEMMKENHMDPKERWLRRITIKKVVITSPGEAAAIKLYRNAALAVNVELANLIYGVCDVYGLKYDTIKRYFMEDETLGNHWQVPGPDEKFGFGGTCLPKDLTHASSLVYNKHNIMEMALKANKARRDDE